MSKVGFLVNHCSVIKYIVCYLYKTHKKHTRLIHTLYKNTINGNQCFYITIYCVMIFVEQVERGEIIYGKYYNTF